MIFRWIASWTPEGGELKEMKDMLSIGMVGLDTSHAIAFTELLNDSGHPYHILGGKVTAAYPGGSPNLPISASRVDGYATQLQERFEIQLVESLEELAGQCDAMLLESVDGSVHEEQFAAVAACGKPVFIDKPLAFTTEEAIRIVKLAQQYNVPLMSSSALRYAEALTAALQAADAAQSASVPTGPSLAVVQGIDAYGPTPREAGFPGWFWYGIHTVEMVYAAMGAGCEQVEAMPSAEGELIIGRWKDGRIATIRGNQHGGAFGAVLHSAAGSVHAEIASHPKPFYASLLEQIVNFFHTKQSPLPIAETVEIIAFLEAVNESLASRKPVALGHAGLS
ncbi:Gfo/Idh/MocA family protein [Paenibacillus sp. OSY-SE]|uniref:Gfo/Idh/MocA family protein n=1 Tax=Paenibacillus sp. OSY-SE TaxID=1196323 RepID=UPI00030B1BE2|nr:Gfo/Idh/MocA family oxidoreductase [Paenibacillus sp. OSY-SE]